MVTDDDISDTMINFGGSFVGALGWAFRRADIVNRARLKAAFSQEWNQYRELAELKLKQQQRSA